MGRSRLLNSLFLVLLFFAGLSSCNFNASIPEYINKNLYHVTYKTIYFQPSWYQGGQEKGPRGWSYYHPVAGMDRAIAVWKEKNNAASGFGLTFLEDITGPIPGLSGDTDFIDLSLFPGIYGITGGALTFLGDPYGDSKIVIDYNISSLDSIFNLSSYTDNFDVYVFENLHFTRTTSTSLLNLTINSGGTVILKDCFIDGEIRVPNGSLSLSGNIKIDGEIILADFMPINVIGTISLDDNRLIKVSYNEPIYEGMLTLTGDNLAENCGKFEIGDGSTWELDSNGRVKRK